MARRLLIGCVLLLGAAIASCSDATGPAGTFLVTVSPDTMHLGENGVVPRYVITYTARFVSDGQHKVWMTLPAVETEVTPGRWSAPSGDPNNLYLQGALGDASMIVMNGNVSSGSVYPPIAPGRYRLRVRFQVAGPSATQASGDVFEATSNVFVLVSP